MIQWDTIETVPCDPQNPEATATGSSCTGTDGSGGGEDIPGTDERCGDPAFRKANPVLCANYPKLILKPETAIIEPGKTQTYTVYLQQGGTEIVLTTGLTFVISDDDIAFLTQNGVATGVQAGIATVSVQWQTLHAYAILEVVTACADLNQKFFIVIDNSLSSSQQFSNQYASKLIYAKLAAGRFIDSVDFSKDSVGVISFAESGIVQTTFVTTAAAAKAAVDAITVLQESTALAAGLQKAVDNFGSDPDSRKVIILFSDLENNFGADPAPVADSFKGAYGTIVVVALRAWGTFFAKGYDLSSAGYFLSAYQATQEDTITTLQGLKSFLCAGSCSPTTGTYPMAKLNYTGFINWDVTQGRVDLVGLGLCDVDAGNGLYVDMAGTYYKFVDTAPYPMGQLTSKDEFTFTSGQDYRFSIRIAGNRRDHAGDYKVRLQVGTFIDQIVTVSDPSQGLQDAPNPYIYNFTPGSTVAGRIVITGVDSPVGRVINVGLLIDEVILTNLTTATVLLTDNFDTENPTTIVPDSNYQYGCLVTPPEAQVADPTPPPTLSEP